MDFNQTELRRETVFKEAVISAAEAKRVEIIGAAQREAGAELNEAERQCERADHAIIAEAYARQGEREHSAVMQSGRREMLRYREKLVNDVFFEIEKKLAAFTKGEKYLPWMLARLAKCRKAGTAGGGYTVYIRKEDEGHKAAIEKEVPGAKVVVDADIRLGGAKLGDGKVLYDETLDLALAGEKERFYTESGLSF